MPENGPVVGVIGGVGSGKSTFADCLRTFGAELIDADRIGHELLRRDEIKRQIRRRWGDAVFDEKGLVDRGALGKVVFADSEELAHLSEIVHPELVKELRKQIEASRGVVVLDAALLTEFALEKKCDYVVFVEADLERRQERTSTQRQWSPGEIARRESFQKPLKAKRSLATHVVLNNGDIECLKEQAKKLWQEMMKPRVTDFDTSSEE